jgi:hypothetical protein
MHIEMILQGKGGVGKSLVAALLAQYFTNQGEAPLCVDTDPVNATFSGYKAFQVETLNIMDGDDINPRAFDQLIERIMTTDQNRMVIDNGASTFVPLCSYLLQNGVVDLLSDAGHSIRLHTVITGGQALPDTIEGFSSLARNIAGAPIVCWINEYFGKPVKDGKSFEESKVFDRNKGRVEALVTVPAVKPETFGHDMNKMMTRRDTFAEATASADYTIMARAIL